MQLFCGLWLQRPELVWSHCRGLDWLSSHCGSATVDPTKHQEYKTYWSRPRRKVPLRLRRKGTTILPSPRSFGSPQVGVCRLNSTFAFASGNPKTWLRDDWCSPFWGTFLDWQRALWVPSSLKTTSTIRPWPKNTPMILLHVSLTGAKIKEKMTSSRRPGCGRRAQWHDWARPGRTSREEVHRSLEVARGGLGNLWLKRRCRAVLRDWCTICHYDYYFGLMLGGPWKVSLSPPKACLRMILRYFPFAKVWYVSFVEQRCLVGLTWHTLMQLLDRRAHDWTWSLQSRWEARPLEIGCLLVKKDEFLFVGHLWFAFIWLFSSMIPSFFHSDTVYSIFINIYIYIIYI